MAAPGGAGGSGTAGAGKTATKADDSKTGARRQLTEWARAAVPVVAGAIGISGFVSILGAGVLWVRFSAAHVPPEQAVGDLPAHSLLATGAVTLILPMNIKTREIVIRYRGNLSSNKTTSSKKLGLTVRNKAGKVVGPSLSKKA